MKKKELEERLEFYQNKAMYFRRLAYVYRYGRQIDVESLINEIDEFEFEREIGSEEIYAKLNKIIAKYFFPLKEQLRYLGNPTVVDFKKVGGDKLCR